MDDTHGRFFTYGNNAEELFKLMLPILKEYEFLKNATVQLNFVNEEHQRDLEFKLSTITADQSRPDNYRELSGLRLNT
jgi:hypothetical protein